MKFRIQQANILKQIVGKFSYCNDDCAVPSLQFYFLKH